MVALCDGVPDFRAQKWRPGDTGSSSAAFMASGSEGSSSDTEKAGVGLLSKPMRRFALAARVAA
jgi:hypothetical protein